MRFTLLSTLIIACATFGSCAVSPYTSGPNLGANPSLLPFAEGYEKEMANGQFFIGPDDKLTIDFWKETDLSRTYTVDRNGEVLFPLVGSLTASDLTRETFEKNLLEAYKKYYVDPVLALSIEFYPSRKVTVLGEVNSKSIISLTSPNTTILDVIAMAGGLTSDGDTAGVLIARSSIGGVMNVRHYSLDGLFAPTDINMRYEGHTYVQKGDIVYVVKSSSAEYAAKLELVSDTLRALQFGVSAISKSNLTIGTN